MSTLSSRVLASTGNPTSLTWCLKHWKSKHKSFTSFEVIEARFKGCRCKLSVYVVLTHLVGTWESFPSQLCYPHHVTRPQHSILSPDKCPHAQQLPEKSSELMPKLTILSYHRLSLLLIKGTSEFPFNINQNMLVESPQAMGVSVREIATD